MCRADRASFVGSLFIVSHGFWNPSSHPPRTVCTANCAVFRPCESFICRANILAGADFRDAPQKFIGRRATLPREEFSISGFLKRVAGTVTNTRSRSIWKLGGGGNPVVCRQFNFTTGGENSTHEFCGNKKLLWSKLSLELWVWSWCLPPL